MLSRFLPAHFRKIGYGFLLIALLQLQGCISMPLLDQTGAKSLTVRAPSASEYSVSQDAVGGYRLSVGDQIEVKLFYNPELNENLVIRPDGKISMQLIGEQRIAGLTPAETENLLVQKFTGIVKEPVLTVIVRKYVTQRVYIGGEVHSQSSVPMEGPMTLMQAVFHAGGFKFNAERRNVLVFRNNGLPDAKVFMVNLDQQLDVQGSAEPQCEPAPQCQQDPATGQIRLGDIALYPNDIVYVPQTGIGKLAQFLDENIAKIIPLYKNMGVNLYYDLHPRKYP